MEYNINRRTFLGVGAAAAALALAGCTPRQPTADSEESDASRKALTADQMPPADATESCDLVVVGAAGVSGMVATMHAVECGLNVIPLDRANSFLDTNTANYGGVFALETPDRLEQPAHVTKQAFFEKFIESCDSQANFAAIRNMIANSAETTALVESCGDVFYPMAGPDPVTELVPGVKYFASYTVDCWLDELYGESRVPYLEKQFADRGIECRFGCSAVDLLFDGERVTGVRYEDGNGKIVDVTADNVILCCGGCAHNEELVAEYAGGAKVVGVGSMHVDGSGIRMARSVGAAKSKNFALDMVEFGAANPKASPQYSYIGQEGPLTLALAAGLFVNGEGCRFMPENTLMRGAMFCSDAFVRQGTYYVVIDQAAVEAFSTKPLLEALGAAAGGLNPGMEVEWAGTILSTLKEDLAVGVEGGWVFTGATLEELGEAMGAPALAATVEAYNKCCESGEDLQFYKPAELLVPVCEGPFYAIECMPAVFNTMGGVKVDGFCRAVRDDGSYIPGLFVTGSDADLWSTQYTYGNTCQGFESMSGYLAADICAGNEDRYRF